MLPGRGAGELMDRIRFSSVEGHCSGRTERRSRGAEVGARGWVRRDSPDTGCGCLPQGRSRGDREAVKFVYIFKVKSTGFADSLAVGCDREGPRMMPRARRCVWVRDGAVGCDADH